MKNKIYLIAIVFISVLISSCESDEISHQDDFQKSSEALQNFKKATNDSYKYIVTSQSWIGIAWETTITVSNGKIVERHFKYTKTEGGSNIPQEELEWTENESEIGNHKNNGAPALTLDEIYVKAQQEWLLKRDNTETYFEAKNNGLLSTCGYIEKGCQDDCFVGIHIKSIEPISF